MRCTAVIAALILWVNPLRGISQQSPAATPGVPARAEVLIVGTYHMTNPGRDIYNMQADDVLAPKRQAEIGEVIATLRKFNPTKIGVERNAGDARIASDYADYLAGRHELTRNEIEQLGFRLAEALGQKAIYPVDADGEFPYQRLVNYAKAAGRSRELQDTMDVFGERVKAQGEYLASHTILETLLFMNAHERVAQEVGLYYRLAHLGEPWDWAGADLVSDWFRRNMRIFGNIVQLADTPRERVLVIFGSGHLGWLQHAVASDPTLRLRTLAEFAS